jgi:hypothetical protein
MEAQFVVGGYEAAEPLAWRWHNGWVFPLQLALVGVFLVMSVWDARYRSRLRRLRDGNSVAV